MVQTHFFNDQEQFKNVSNIFSNTIVPNYFHFARCVFVSGTIAATASATQQHSNVAKVIVYCVPPVLSSASNYHSSASKTTQALIRAPLESPHPQLSNGFRMNAGVVLHAELLPLEIEGGTGGTQHKLLLPSPIQLLNTLFWKLIWRAGIPSPNNNPQNWQ